MPPELLEYVENGRNPDIYTREFVELVRRGNQLMSGKMHAFASFRDVLAHNMTTAMPELRDDVARVLEATGGGGSSSTRAAANGSGGTAAAAATTASTSNTTPAAMTAEASNGAAAAGGTAPGGGDAALSTSG